MEVIDSEIREYIMNIVGNYHQYLLIKKWKENKFDKGWNNNPRLKIFLFDHLIIENLHYKELEFLLFLRKFIGILKNKDYDTQLKKYILEQIAKLYKKNKYKDTNDLIKLLLKPMYDNISRCAHVNSRSYKLNPKSKSLIQNQRINIKQTIDELAKIICFIFEKNIVYQESTIYSYDYFNYQIDSILEKQKHIELENTKIIKLFEEIIKEESIEPFVNLNIGIF